jgi:hypothetical protein
MCYESGGELTMLDQGFRKIRSKQLLAGCSFSTHCWNLNGLFVLVEAAEKNQILLKYKETGEP